MAAFSTARGRSSSSSLQGVRWESVGCGLGVGFRVLLVFWWRVSVSCGCTTFQPDKEGRG